MVTLLRVEILGQELMSGTFRGLEAAIKLLSPKPRECLGPIFKATADGPLEQVA